MNAFIITASLCVLTLAPYGVWASRWNIPAHASLGLAITAYLVPGLLTDGIPTFARDTVDLYADMLLVGTFFFCIGCGLGAVLKYTPSRKVYFFTDRNMPGWWEKVFSRRVKLIGILSIVGLLLSFALMGFIPLFAEDPMAAKFFRGQYRDAYQKVAPLYRSCHFTLTLLVPILLARWSDTGNKVYLALGILSAGVMTLSLTRSPAATGIIMWMGIWAANHRRYFLRYLFFVSIAYSLGGASIILFLAYVLGDSPDLTIWEYIAQGAPDILDQLYFLEAFERREEFTYGLTIVGGLVPGNYKWNPGVWTLSVLTDSDDITNVVSGGLRLPVPLWGYLNFGWVGVVVISFLTGLLTARSTLYLRRNIRSLTYTHSAIVLGIHGSVWYCVVNFYRLSYYTVFQMVIIYLLAGAWGGLRKGSPKKARAVPLLSPRGRSA